MGEGWGRDGVGVCRYGVEVDVSRGVLGEAVHWKWVACDRAGLCMVGCWQGVSLEGRDSPNIASIEMLTTLLLAIDYFRAATS